MSSREEGFQRSEDYAIPKDKDGKEIGDYDSYYESLAAGKLSDENLQHVRIGKDLREFEDLVKTKSLTRLTLYGVPNGFTLVGGVKITRRDEEIEDSCFLMTKSYVQRNLKNPQTAFKIIHAMGVKRFLLDISEWQPKSFYSRHDASVRSRRIRETAGMNMLNKAIEEKGLDLTYDKSLRARFVKFTAAVGRAAKSKKTELASGKLTYNALAEKVADETKLPEQFRFFTEYAEMFEAERERLKDIPDEPDDAHGEESADELSETESPQ